MSNTFPYNNQGNNTLQCLSVQKHKFWLSIISLIILSVCCRPDPVSAKGNSFVFEHFSQENGLSNNQVQCIFQDVRGFLWFGTSQGLSRFDGYRFRVFEQNSTDSSSLKGDLIRCVFQSSKGEMYFGTEHGGLNYYDINSEKFLHPFDNFPELNLVQTSVNCIVEDLNDRLWIGTEDGLLVYSPNHQTLEKPALKDLNPEEPFSGNFIRVMVFGNNGKLWMGTNNGIYSLDTLRNEVSYISLPLPYSSNDEIWELTTESNGNLWVGTYENGAFLIDNSGKTLEHIIPDPQNERSRTVRAIVADKSGNFWMGTRGGAYIYRHGEGITNSFVHDEREIKSLAGNSVLSIFHDAKGDTWIGTRSGVSFLVHSKQAFRGFRAMPGDNRYLNSKDLFAFWHAPDGKLWIGTEDGGVNIYNPTTYTFTYLTHQPGDISTLSSDCIKALMDDGKGNVWVGTYRGGISIVNIRSGRTIRHFRHTVEDGNSLGDDRVWDLLHDKSGNIWAATSAGLEKYNPDTEAFVLLNIFPANTQVNWIRQDSHGDLWIGAIDEVVVYSPEAGVLNRFQEFSRSFIEDKKGNFWITTLSKGLAKYSKTDGPQNYYTESQGLPDNQVLCILEDDDNHLWISTTHGLARFNPETGFTETFTSKDGLQNDQFNYGAALKLPGGELVFGGIDGFNIFHPDEVKGNDYAAPIILTDLRIFNRPVSIGTDKKSILTKSITETTEITVPFSQNVISVEFAALNFVNSAGNLYSYFLEGFDKTWNDPSPNRMATYTNLDPGTYKLHIKSVIPGNSEIEKSTALVINILPPYWKTWWFKTLFTLFIGLILITLIKFLLNRENLKNQLGLERLKARKMHELDMMKLRFFTNISHEIRTPLTLILGPLEKLKSANFSQNEFPSLVDIMDRNAKKLNRLINQILDFRKLETGNLKLNYTDGEMAGFLRQVVGTFGNWAEEKGINLTFKSTPSEINCRFDPDKLEKIVSNLLSNAFKYTDADGQISVNLSLKNANRKTKEPTDNLENHKTINITVSDTGKGIPEKYVNKIFVRFFQSEEPADVPGTGIGLALTMEVVKLHKGEIFVSSKPGEGSKFTVKLPFIGPLSDTGASESLTPPELTTEPGLSENPDAQVMLIVDDNPDVRTFVRLHFDPVYQIVEAIDGLDAWEKALRIIPDIILCDVMMPQMDGFELLKKLKNDERTSHIPVIILTALGTKKHEIEGLSIGADDFISKPFDIALLQTKIENILSIRKALQQKYSGEILLQPKNILVSAPDERFLSKAIEVVEANISDPYLDIERFALKVGVSRTQLYRKLHALTDMTVKEFIRDIRLKRATQLLLQQKLNISEIAYSVGFRDLSHFRKSFRQQFGMSASEYAQKKGD